MSFKGSGRVGSSRWPSFSWAVEAGTHSRMDVQGCLPGMGIGRLPLYSSDSLGCLWPGPSLPPELPHTVSVSGLELSCPGKVDSEVMTLNARQLDSNFKKLHSLRVEMKEKLPSKT